MTRSLGFFDEILEEEEEDKILENEILENDRNWENPSMTREIGKSKVGNPSGRDLENQSIDKEIGNSKAGCPNAKRVRYSRPAKKEEKPHVYTSLTTEKAEVEARKPKSKKLPRSYEKVIESPEGDLWGESMDREVKSLEEIKFGEIVDRPKDRKIMRCRWFYALEKTKRVKLPCTSQGLYLGEILKFMV